MSRTTIPSRDQLPVDSQATLESLDKLFGFVPNAFAVIAQSPYALKAFKGLQIPLEKTLDPNIRECIALAVSEVSGCEYSIRVHSYIGARFSNLGAAELQLSRDGKSSDPKTGSAAQFAKKVAEMRGKVTDADLKSVRDAGWTDAQIIEIIARIAQFLFTNFVSNVFQTEIDFPSLEAVEGELQKELSSFLDC
ncbi:carboxymuconolactone decarboxylase family protein [Burkholderia sp. Ac-20365]|uniref:carboxymuconolactone decarboxylase family protein n=1 Tax=Burkholderia sp. Ac-20365 TaxID=2703897 RepID=UPI00197BD8FD|nr:carboxymuconolactone decarboxylase family protein [Burkholderia sp. Ac-20365]MBN3759240.1 carboxymuconolactone decarboxylase family protein [Burkholderia sp. Ac-20365]